MIFSTPLFLFVFLPVFLAIYYLLPFKARSAWILVASYAFYGWWRVDFLALFFAVTLWSYLFSQGIVKAQQAGQEKRAKYLLWAALSGNLAALGYFKYFNFGLENFNALIQSMGGTPIVAWHVILPIGISFYVFQSMSYIIDVYRKDAQAAQNFWDFSAFIALFPQLIAGPILRYKDLADQFAVRSHTFEKFSQGAMRFMMGFCKKVLIADMIAPVVNATLFHPTPTMADAWLGTIAFTLQIFFDFSGYSDMAIGLGLMMGFRFCENFDHPYYAKSIGEFWRSWHMSLSSWIRDYIYYPLGGNRHGNARTYFNVAVVMILTGIWHGANWTFIIYGFIHAAMLIRERHWIYTGRWKERPAYIAIPLTMFAVILARVLFVSPDIATAWNIYKGTIGFYGFGLSEFLYWEITGLQIFMMVFAAIFSYAAPLWLNYLKQHPMRLGLQHSFLVMMPLFVLAVSRLSAQTYSPFLYFNF